MLELQYRVFLAVEKTTGIYPSQFLNTSSLAITWETSFSEAIKSLQCSTPTCSDFQAISQCRVFPIIMSQCHQSVIFTYVYIKLHVLQGILKPLATFFSPAEFYIFLLMGHIISFTRMHNEANFP